MAKGLNTVELIPKVDNFMQLDFNPMLDMMKKAYHDQGYGLNDFAQRLEGKVVGSKVEFLSSPYAFYMLYGRLPGRMPPIQKIAEWCEYKHITFKSAPYLIARKIANEGTKGNNWLYPIIPDINDEIVTQIQNNLKKQMMII